MYTSRIFANEGDIISGLRTLPGVQLVVQDLAQLSFEQQVRLIGNTSLIIGMHGKQETRDAIVTIMNAPFGRSGNRE